MANIRCLHPSWTCTATDPQNTHPSLSLLHLPCHPSHIAMSTCEHWLLQGSCASPTPGPWHAKRHGTKLPGARALPACHTTSARGGFLFSSTGQKNDNCMVYPVGCLVPLFSDLTSSCRAVLCSLFSCLFLFLLLLGQIRRKGIGRAVRKAQLFHPLQLSSAAPQRTTVFLTCNKRQQRCNAVPRGRHRDVPGETRSCLLYFPSPTVPALPWFLSFCWAEHDLSRRAVTEHSAPQPCTTLAAAHEKSPPRTLHC